MELTNTQQAMCYQALYNALGPVVKANGDGLRGDVDREMRQLWEQTGAKTFKVRAGDVELGTYSVTESKATPEREEVEFVIEDDEALGGWIAANPEMVTDFFMEYGGGDFMSWLLKEVGELPDGVSARVTTMPAKPASYKGSTIRVDKAFQAKVQRRMVEGLAALVAPASALLGSGADE